MSGLHEAVTDAIASESYEPRPDAADRAAAVAIRVVLAEAQRVVEALPVERPRSFKRRAVIDLGDALAALAALAENTP